MANTAVIQLFEARVLSDLQGQVNTFLSTIPASEVYSASVNVVQKNGKPVYLGQVLYFLATP